LKNFNYRLLVNMLAAKLLLARGNFKDSEPVSHTVDGIFCNACNKRMVFITDDIYECSICSLRHHHQIIIAATNNTDELQTRDAFGKMHKTRTRRADYRLSQIQKNRTDLILKNDAYAQRTGCPKVPEEIIDEAVRFYSSVQTMYFNLCRKKFVKRGNRKNQILAYLVYEFMNIKHLSVQRSTIINIFELDETGFSSGETQILEIIKILGIDLNHDPMDVIVDLATRYLKNLDNECPGKIFTQKNIQFVIDLITRTLVIKCGMRCYICSRVAGAVYILIKELGFSFKNKVIETACDHCKKNTFERFRKTIKINLHYFTDIFDEFHRSKAVVSSVQIRKLPHTIKYLGYLIEEHPDVDEFRECLVMVTREDAEIADDIDFNVDSILKKYKLFPSS